MALEMVPTDIDTNDSRHMTLHTSRQQQDQQVSDA